MFNVSRRSSVVKFVLTDLYMIYVHSLYTVQDIILLKLFHIHPIYSKSRLQDGVYRTQKYDSFFHCEPELSFRIRKTCHAKLK